MFNSNVGNEGPGDKMDMASQPMPPLPDLKSTNGNNSQVSPQDPFEATMAQIRPVSMAVNEINNQLANIVRSGAIPDISVIAQLSQLVNSLVPLAAQNMIKPGMGGGGMGGMMAGAPPPPDGAQSGIPGGAGPGMGGMGGQVPPM